MGVSAEVILDRQGKRATVSLSGVPVGGRVSGKAELGDGGKGGEESIVIHEPLKSMLARRFVKIVDARHDEASDCVLVVVRLPLALGKRTIVLTRVVV